MARGLVKALKSLLKSRAYETTFEGLMRPPNLQACLKTFKAILTSKVSACRKNNWRISAASPESVNLYAFQRTP